MRFVRWERVELGFGEKRLAEVVKFEEETWKQNEGKKNSGKMSRKRVERVAEEIIAAELAAAGMAATHSAPPPTSASASSSPSTTDADAASPSSSPSDLEAAPASVVEASVSESIPVESVTETHEDASLLFATPAAASTTALGNQRGSSSGSSRDYRGRVLTGCSRRSRCFPFHSTTSRIAYRDGDIRINRGSLPRAVSTNSGRQHPRPSRQRHHWRLSRPC